MAARRQKISGEDRERLIAADARGEDYVDLARQLGIKIEEHRVLHHSTFYGGATSKLLGQ